MITLFLYASTTHFKASHYKPHHIRRTYVSIAKLSTSAIPLN